MLLFIAGIFGIIPEDPEILPEESRGLFPFPPPSGIGIIIGPLSTSWFITWLKVWSFLFGVIELESNDPEELNPKL